MKRTFFNTKPNGQAAIPTSQRDEVLFFATTHFLVFNFLANSQNTLSYFFRQTNPIQKKNEIVFSPTLYSVIK